jgi:hypothetical protein
MVGVDRPRDELVERNDLGDEHDRKRVRADGELDLHDALPLRICN